MQRKTKNKIYSMLLVLLCFLPYQNCGQNYETQKSSALSQNCEGADCENGEGEEVVTPQCMFNGTTIAEGASVEAYFVSASPDCAQKEVRTCQNGILSGSYGFASCSTFPESKQSCLFNTMNISDGNTVTAFQSQRVPYGQMCTSEQRTCNDGTLSGQYQFAACSVSAPLSCQFNGATIAHNGSVLAFTSATVPFGQTCTSTTRTCTNGVLSGSNAYAFATCRVEAAPLPPPPPPPPAGASTCDSYPHARKINISTVAQLLSVPTQARAGDLFVLAPGTYLLDSVVFENLRGTSSQMITLCGEGAARIVGPGARSSKRILTLKNSEYVRMAQLDFSLGMKGLMVEGTSYSRFEKLTIHDVGHEALHLMLWSHHNVISDSRFFDTGQDNQGLGEGVYIGTSLNKGIEDASDFNQVLNNQFGPGITAEHIDIKEYTARGLIEGNQFDGRGIAQVLSAESWVNVKGNYYMIRNNVGRNTPVRGFKQIVLVPGQGNFNTFENNRGELNNTNPDRMFIYIHRESTDAPNNVVRCNNQVLDQPIQYMTNARRCAN